MALTLAIDTATAACSVALIRDGEVVARADETVGRGHAERLMPMADALLADAGRPVPARVLVDCGPGSFTGLRVGLASAIGLGIGWGVPVAGFSSLPAIAAALFADEPALETCAVALTGGHGELFVQRFAAPLRPLCEPVSLTPEDAAEAIGERVVAGSGAEALILARGGRGEALHRLPHAADARLLPPALLGPARPLYGRAPDAKPRAA